MIIFVCVNILLRVLNLTGLLLLAGLLLIFINFLIIIYYNIELKSIFNSCLNAYKQTKGISQVVLYMPHIFACIKVCLLNVYLELSSIDCYQ